MPDNGARTNFVVPLEIAPMLFILDGIFNMLDAQVLEGDEREAALVLGRERRAAAWGAANQLAMQKGLPMAPDGGPIDLSKLRG